MSLRPFNHYLKSSLATTTSSDLTDVRLTVRSVETISLGTGTLSQTVGVVAANEVRPLTDITISVVNGQFLSDVTLTISSAYHRHADLITFDYTPADIPVGRSIIIKDDRNGNTLTTITNASSGLLRLSLDATTNTWVVTETIESLDANPTFNTVTVTGSIRNANGTAGAPSYTYTNFPTTGFFSTDAGNIRTALSGVESWSFTTGGQIVGSVGGGIIQMNTSGAVLATASGTNQHITLTPSGSGMVLIGAGANGYSFADAQGYGMFYGGGTQIAFKTAFGVNTTLTGAHMLLGGLTADGTGVLQFPAATTSAGGISFGGDTFLYRSAAGIPKLDSAGDSLLSFCTNGTSRGLIGGSSTQLVVQAFTSMALNTNNGTTSLTLDTSQNAIFAANVTIPAANLFQWTGRGVMQAPSDGVIELTNAAQTGFTRLQFGGTTASFPALRRNGGTLECVLADASASAAFTCGTLTSGAAGVGGAAASGTTALVLPAGTTGASPLRFTTSGTAPTSPVDGDMWYDGTNVKFRVGGTTKTFTLV